MTLGPFQPQRPQVTIETFQALDLRVGRGAKTSQGVVLLLPERPAEPGSTVF